MSDGSWCDRREQTEPFGAKGRAGLRASGRSDPKRNAAQRNVGEGHSQKIKKEERRIKIYFYFI